METRFFTHAQSWIDSNQILHLNSLDGYSDTFEIVFTLVQGFGVGCEFWLLPLTLVLASNTAYCATVHTVICNDDVYADWLLSVVAGPSYKNSLQNFIQRRGLEMPKYNPITQLNGTFRLTTTSSILHNAFGALLVHGQVTIIFVVSVCLSVCLCRVFLSRLWSDFDQTRTYIICGSSCVP